MTNIDTPTNGAHGGKSPGPSQSARDGWLAAMPRSKYFIAVVDKPESIPMPSAADVEKTAALMAEIEKLLCADGEYTANSFTAIAGFAQAISNPVISEYADPSVRLFLREVFLAAGIRLSPEPRP